MRIFSSRSLSAALFLSWLLDFSPPLSFSFSFSFSLSVNSVTMNCSLFFRKGKGCWRVDQLRGEQGSDLVVEIVLHDLLVDLAHVVDVQHLDVLGAQQLPQ